MFPLLSYLGEGIQVVLSALTVVLAVVSVSAYRRKPEARYLLLMLAFVFLCAISLTTVSLEMFTGFAPGMVPVVEQYLIPSLELLMVVSFLVAILWSRRARKKVIAGLTMAMVVVLGMTAYLSVDAVGSGAQPVLPVGCDKPLGGFLIVATSLGYNDSIEHGAPVKVWPVIDVVAGTNVTIAVCNSYSESVGFQVTHYLAGEREVIHPGQVADFSFVADRPGTYTIYCSVFNSIHIYMQSGELNVL